ncbi:MAG: DUF1573 domain-containing protein [Bacteroidia bacterium]|nr:DUF1573 domain-containing protein [Bacteroidia bacterium]MBT8230525.1 DUF1573 domain-containing protein [Bacteroidia bacterium]NNK90673.1 DUF1573 domain-containing protein [Saprospiraceae bacterium]
MILFILTLLLQIPGDVSSYNSTDYYVDQEAITFADAQRIVKMTFDDPHQELGKVIRGEKRELNFDFINDGNEAIKIELVSACECTTLDWPRKAVAPGEKGTIHAVFDSSEKEASETIEIDIYLENTDPETNRPIMKIVSYTFEMD